MRFPRQEYWSVLPCPSPGDLPDPGIEPMSLESPALAGRLFTTSATWEAPISGSMFLYIFQIKYRTKQNKKAPPAVAKQVKITCIHEPFKPETHYRIFFWWEEIGGASPFPFNSLDLLTKYLGLDIAKWWF